MSAVGGEASRRLTLKINSMLGKDVTVILKNGVRYRGRVAGIDPATLTIALEGAQREGAEGQRQGQKGASDAKSAALVIISGSSISEIILAELEVFDAREFAEFLARYGGIARHNITVYPETNVVEVSRSVRVTKTGVEGSGPLAQRIYTLFKEYMRRKGVER